MVDTELLKKVIDDSGIRREDIAKNAGLTRESLWNKLSGRTEFTASEMASMKKDLRLSNTRFRRIFFATERELNSQQEETV